MNADFEQLRQRLLSPAGLNPAQSDPIYYLVFSPKETLTVYRLLPGWIAQLESNGWRVKTLPLGKLIWELVDESGRWDEWLEIEAESDQESVNEAIRNVLRTNNALIDRVAQEVTVEEEKTVVIVTEVELLHPYFRLRVIENHLNNKVRIPTVFLYPGRRAGQYGLHFLDFYPEDPGYRSTLIGGLE
ncbi:MAG: DUF1788 domain-containing protein [Anaerolineaceae bacterium]|nr:DUF1788 domain-containing protein [Anaerolineaceae bacterium]